ncbi:MAG: AAA family ATPase, partial [Solirubrobacteraceae bacterium]
MTRLILGREHELARIRELIDRAQAGSGGVVVLEGPAGIGKTALLAEAARRAERLEFSVLHGAGARLELEYGFGVVRQLFARVLGSRPRASDLFEGAARLAEMPLGLADATDESADSSGDPSAAMHGLFWLTANLAERGPVLIAIDDAHWADAMSLRFALYLARRVDDLPVALLIVTRAISEQVHNEPLTELSALPGATRLRPGPLTELDVGRLIEHNRVHDADERFVTACYRATGGN